MLFPTDPNICLHLHRLSEPTKSSNRNQSLETSTSTFAQPPTKAQQLQLAGLNISIPDITLPRADDSLAFAERVCLGVFASLGELPDSWAARVRVYGVAPLSRGALRVYYELSASLVLVFPALFALGLVPQLSSLLVYLVERLETACFGGSGVCGVASALWCALKGLLAVGILWPLCYRGLRVLLLLLLFACSRSVSLSMYSVMYKLMSTYSVSKLCYLLSILLVSCAQAHGAQQSLEFSIYVAVLFSICYVLSRLPNNPQLLLALFRDRLSALSLHALVERIHSHQQKKALLRQLAARRKQHRSAPDADAAACELEAIELEALSRAREPLAPSAVHTRCAY